jgi:hypothetical protein
MEHLQQRVEDTAAVVQAWGSAISRLEAELNTANLAVMRAKKQRETHALKAAMSDEAALAAVKQARIEQQSAEATIGDIEISLPQARAELASAEREAAGARRAVARVMAEQLMKKRIEVSGRIDSVIADLLTPLLDEYEKLGGEIVNMPDVVSRSIFGVASNETALGLRRVRAALPKIFDRIFPNAQYDEMKKAPLEKSEAEHWNLPPVDEASKAA